MLGGGGRKRAVIYKSGIDKKPRFPSASDNESDWVSLDSEDISEASESANASLASNSPQKNLE